MDFPNKVMLMLNRSANSELLKYALGDVGVLYIIFKALNGISYLNPLVVMLVKEDTCRY